MNRTDRLYALVEELRAVAPRPRSARWLADRFEVSSRTIERDLSALQQSGVPIWAEPGRTGGYCLDASHTLAPLGFTVDEALAVSISLEMLATSPFREAASSALRKVVAVMNDRHLAETEELSARVHLLTDGPVAESSEERAPELVPELASALRTGQVLRISYADKNGARSTREIEPMGWVGRGQHWYLVAWCRDREAIRAFRGDRIARAEPTGETPARRTLNASDLDISFGELRSITTSEKTTSQTTSRTSS
ncbi:transcriptional regulator [Agreia sp. Leaf244]|uniref:helix-turn-helix transcriptional regulator n=1 Tax=Agreia sp. Leaf244 TaxID=1736305 RepID=UPI0006F60040|nr:YafY family protein [Agreia sp. Leaf244]KQO11501.1 transcriptional regulator [Agreia sp. Leaf244]